MPELPEVETLRRSIEPFLLNQKIVDVEIRDPRLRWPVVAQDFERWAVGPKIERLSRRSKYLLWHLDNEATVVIHLGMSGRLGRYAPSEPIEKHTHVIFVLNNNLQIRYRDPRRFGLVEMSPPGELSTYPRFKNLGVEPLSDDFNAKNLKKWLKTSKKPIKNWIMDAQNVVGVGNIYANEALFKAGIRPDRPASFLTDEEQKQLVEHIKEVLKQAISKGGTTLNDFRDASGEPGFFQLVLLVYQREGELCNRCKTPIERLTLAGRSSFFCPTCQK